MEPVARARAPAPQPAARPSLSSYSTLFFSLAVLPLLARAERIYRNMPRVTPQPDTADLPALSIIIPARNEAHNLQRLLPSLQGQVYAGDLEIIVVDDHSTDGTADLIRETIRGLTGDGTAGPDYCTRLIAAPDLPPDWLGKPHASHTGACAAHGEWLLFTDADTVHHAASAASAVAFAEAHGLDGLSIFLHQEMRSVMDGAVLMVAFAGLFAGLQPPTSMLNGQYVLLRRQVYEQTNGFAAVKDEMMEDLAYGRLLAEQGFRVPMMRGESLASVRMYADWRQMWHGITRLGSGSLRYGGLLALVPAVLITGILMPVWAPLVSPRVVRQMPGLSLLWLAALGGYIPWARRFGQEPQSADGHQTWTNAGTRPLVLSLLAPVAALFVQAAALWGFVSRLLGRGVSWKDRRV